MERNESIKIENIIKSKFEKIIDIYHFEYVKIRNSCWALVGMGFAITLTVGRDGATISYIMPNQHGEIYELDFDTYISRKFDKDDRKGIGKPKNLYETAVAELEIASRGLVSHWDNLLRGDKSWMEDYSKDLFGGFPRKADVYTIKALKPIFDIQRDEGSDNAESPVKFSDTKDGEYYMQEIDAISRGDLNALNKLMDKQGLKRITRTEIEELNKAYNDCELQW